MGNHDQKFISTILSIENRYEDVEHQIEDKISELTALNVIPSELKKKMKGLSLGLIIYEYTLMALQLNREGKRLTLQCKRETAESMNDTIEKKIKNYQNVVKNIVLPTLDAVIQVASIAGGPMALFAQGATVAIRSSTSVLDGVQQSKSTALDHSKK